MVTYTTQQNSSRVAESTRHGLEIITAASRYTATASILGRGGLPGGRGELMKGLGRHSAQGVASARSEGGGSAFPVVLSHEIRHPAMVHVGRALRSENQGERIRALAWPVTQSARVRKRQYGSTGQHGPVIVTNHHESTSVSYSHLPSAISHQPLSSDISHQSSVIRHQSSVISHQAVIVIIHNRVFHDPAISTPVSSTVIIHNHVSHDPAISTPVPSTVIIHNCVFHDPAISTPVSSTANGVGFPHDASTIKASVCIYGPAIVTNHHQPSSVSYNHLLRVTPRPLGFSLQQSLTFSMHLSEQSLTVSIS